MSSAHEYDFTLYFQTLYSGRVKICSAESMLMLKEAAKQDSRKEGRAPDRYMYQFTTSGRLFNDDEVKVRKIERLQYLNEQINR